MLSSICRKHFSKRKNSYTPRAPFKPLPMPPTLAAYNFISILALLSSLFNLSCMFMIFIVHSNSLTKYSLAFFTTWTHRDVHVWECMYVCRYERPYSHMLDCKNSFYSNPLCKSSFANVLLFVRLVRYQVMNVN